MVRIQYNTVKYAWKFEWCWIKFQTSTINFFKIYIVFNFVVRLVSSTFQSYTMLLKGKEKQPHLEEEQENKGVYENSFWHFKKWYDNN